MGTANAQPPASRAHFSWGGAGVTLLATSVIAYASLGKVVDGNVQIQDATGRNLVYEGGSVGTWVALLLLFLGAGCAALGFLTGRVQRLTGSVVTVILGLCLAWWTLGALLIRRHDQGTAALVLTVLGFVIALGAVADPPNRGTMRNLNMVREVAVLGSIGLSLALPAIGTLPCRADKCGAFGSMWTGFFYHENAAASAPLLLLPLAVAYRRPWRRWASFVALAVLVLGSGSRTALVALLVGGLVILLLPGWRSRGLPAWVVWAPVSAYVLSSLFYLDVVPVDLTGRDWVYEAIADVMTGYGGLFGPGSQALAQGTGGWVVGEHGQAPHVLLQLGWVGFVLFLMAMVALTRYQRSKHPQHILASALALVSASRFVTEPSLMFETRTMEFVGVCLLLSLLASPPNSRRPDTATAYRRSLREALDSVDIVRPGGVAWPRQASHRG